MERLSGMDAFFLYLENPTQHMHVTLCTVLDPAAVDGGYDFERVRAHIAGRVHLIPPFRRRLVPVPLRLHHPLWVDDPDFEIDNHVRRAALPSPGGDAELAELTAHIAGLQLDRTRPLWEIWLVEGLAGGRFALIAKVHHSAVDGVSGVEQIITLFDLDPQGRTITPPTPAPPEELPSDLGIVTYAAVSRALNVLDLPSLLNRTSRSLLAVRNRRSEPDATSGGTPLIAPRSSLNGTINARRKVAMARASLDDIKKHKEIVPGATVNDVILSVCAGALRRYLEAFHELPAEALVAGCPINVRTADQQGAADNRVSVMFVPLRTDIADPVERLAATHDAAIAAKDEHALFGSDTLQSWAEIADPNVFTWLFDRYAGSGLVDRHPPAINVMVSNLAGPPFPLYLDGAEVQRAYPMGPIIEGIGLNITVMSYRNSVDFGFMAADNLLPDVDLLAAEIAPELAALAAAANEGTGPVRPPQPSRASG